MWNSQSTLLQVLISIQGLILVSEPYYNEAGYERQKGTQQGLENSRMYNELALLKLLQVCVWTVMPQCYDDDTSDRCMRSLVTVRNERCIFMLHLGVGVSGYNRCID